MRTSKSFPSRDPRRLPDFFCLGSFGYHQHSDDTVLTGYSGKPHYPLPVVRLDIVYWTGPGVSISVPGEWDLSYAYGKCFGHGTRINYWEP